MKDKTSNDCLTCSHFNEQNVYPCTVCIVSQNVGDVGFDKWEQKETTITKSRLTLFEKNFTNFLKQLPTSSRIHVVIEGIN